MRDPSLQPPVTLRADMVCHPGALRCFSEARIVAICELTVYETEVTVAYHEADIVLTAARCGWEAESTFVAQLCNVERGMKDSFDGHVRSHIELVPHILKRGLVNAFLLRTPILARGGCGLRARLLCRWCGGFAGTSSGATC